MQKCIDSFINTRWSDKNDFKYTTLKNNKSQKPTIQRHIASKKKSEHKFYSVINKEIRYN